MKVYQGPPGEVSLRSAGERTNEGGRPKPPLPKRWRYALPSRGSAEASGRRWAPGAEPYALVPGAEPDGPAPGAGQALADAGDQVADAVGITRATGQRAAKRDVALDSAPRQQRGVLKSGGNTAGAGSDAGSATSLAASAAGGVGRTGTGDMSHLLLPYQPL